MQRWKSIFIEQNLEKEFKKVLSPIGFREPDIKDVANMFRTDYKDLDYKGVMNELVNEWDIDESVAKKLYNIAHKVGVV